MQEGLRELEVLLDPYDWFYEAVAEARRYVVYVTYMNSTQDTIIPDFVQGHQVVVHFASSAPDTKSEYVNKPQPNSPFERVLPKEVEPLYVTETPQLPLSTQDLTDELDRLERICGTNILGEIFFERHDGFNAVTNLSSKYPEVRKGIDALYDQYGFNSIYDELEL
jgi:hypothetical protein